MRAGYHNHDAEFRLVEGDAFNSAKLRRSRQRLKDLNFFEKADVTNVPSETAPDRTIIKVDDAAATKSP